MTARLVQQPDGSWLVRCDVHDTLRHAPSYRPAERIAREHNRDKHKTSAAINVGDQVTVGTGKTVWTVTDLWISHADKRPMATLVRNGWTRTSAEVARLKPVTP